MERDRNPGQAMRAGKAGPAFRSAPCGPQGRLPLCR
jgi:hypothetical protein